MDWDRKTAVMWLADDMEVPPAREFGAHQDAVQWDYAIEALDEIYERLERPRQLTESPWMLWHDGTLFSPGQINAVRGLFQMEVVERNGALGKSSDSK